MATEFEKKAFQTSLGIDATIERETKSGEDIARANGMLRMIGGGLNPVPEGYKYVGSAAFHCYVAEASGVATFISQVRTMQDCNELVAIAALQNFSGDLIESFGHKRPGKLRSGF